MKKFIYFAAILACTIVTMTVSSCATAGVRKDVFISYDQLGTDAAYKQFRKANKINQAEILTNLVDQCESQYKRCQTVDDLYDVKENLNVISFWIGDAEQKFIAITKRIRTLNLKINDTIAEVKNQTIIQIQGGSTGYSGSGQEF